MALKKTRPGDVTCDSEPPGGMHDPFARPPSLFPPSTATAAPNARTNVGKRVALHGRNGHVAHDHAWRKGRRARRPAPSRSPVAGRAYFHRGARTLGQWMRSLTQLRIDQVFILKLKSRIGMYAAY